MDTGRNVKQILFISSSYSNKQECYRLPKRIFGYCTPSTVVQNFSGKLLLFLVLHACCMYIVRLCSTYFSLFREESCKSHERKELQISYTSYTLQRQKSNNISISIFHWREHVALTPSVTILDRSSGNRVIGIR